MDCTRIQDDGFVDFMSQHGKLVSLNISNNKLSASIISGLGDLVNLTSLDMSSNPFGNDPDVILGPHFADLTGLEQMRTLNMGRLSGLDRTVMQSVCGMTQLESLSLFFSDVDDAGMSEFVTLSALCELDLGNTRITDLGLQVLCHHPRLAKLFVHYTYITDEGVEYIATLPQLSCLKITMCSRLTDRTLDILTHECPNLTALDISGHVVRDDNVHLLKKLVCLESLGMWSTDVTIQHLMRLDFERSFPRLPPMDTRMKASNGTYIFKREEGQK
eukprot:TRINITY_DN10899_c0_g1_i1.p1 TRINITY_DN10899_c0_g1~~TRINITY_DN10899_c0_g1_i1.p1  ORF type:complete len:274 (-),score=39.00 TRINITY_DN10899_c0_g1_i1:98-919(-)